MSRTDVIDPTPLRRYPRLSGALGIRLWVKHDDAFPVALGGNKARKLVAILAGAEADGRDALVTTGSAGSNHLRAAAMIAAERGWACHLVVHDDPERSTTNLDLARLLGARISWSARSGVVEAMSAAAAALEDEGRHPIVVHGGGHCAEGGLAYVTAVGELAAQLPGEIDGGPDHIVVAAGTATTAAGIAVGAERLLPQARVHAISIANTGPVLATRFGEAVGWCRRSEAGSARRAGVPRQLQIHERFTGGGYGWAAPGVDGAIRMAASTEGLILDPIYVGKAYRALEVMIDEGGVARGAAVILWHTGGALNLLDSMKVGSGTHPDSG